LTWLTADEKDLKGFELQRSTDAKVFKPINWTNAQNAGVYTHHDKDVTKGQVFYYRLKMVDNDGQYQFSTIQSASIPTTHSVTIYPNPTDKNAVLEINTADDTQADLRLLNLEGQSVLTQQIALLKGQNTVSLAIEHLPSGLYFVFLQLKTERIQLKMCKL
jgi:Secretion system C-terminal sorting domain